MPLQTGQVLNNRYRIVKLLGEGGFGAVYRAWDMTFNMPCALKENIESSPQAQRQFQREAQILHTLRHPNLPLVKDYFIVPGQGQYLVMDYIEGDDLQQILNQRGGFLPEHQAVNWLAEICDALAYLHSQKPPVIHRDIKPANIKITPEGKAVLVDFGIFKLYDPDLPTTQGARAVTPGYAPFEQYGHAPTDVRSDIYALGATMYTLLTGKTPVESISRMTGTPLTAPREINPAISPAVETAILKAMQVMPDERYPSIVTFCRDFLPVEVPLLQSEHTMEVAKVAPISSMEVRVAQTSAIAQDEAQLEMKDEQVVPVRVVEPIPGASVGRRNSRRWAIIILVGISLLVAAGVIISQFLPIEQPMPTEEIVEPEIIIDEWIGGMEMLEWPDPREARLVIEHPIDSDHFRGELRIFHPGRDPEIRGLEGFMNPSEEMINFVDSAGWAYWGWYREIAMGGELSLECMHCEVQGAFEFHRP